MSDDDGVPSPARGWAASDLSRLVPDGTLAQPTQVPPTQYDKTGSDIDRVVGGPAVMTPLPRPKPVPKKAATSGLQLGVIARSIVGIALAVAVGFMVYTAWRNITG
jgi:hypothetical protein